MTLDKGDTFKRGPTSWTVLGVGDDGRVFARSSHSNTAWLTCTFPPADSVTGPDDVVCQCFEWGEGKVVDPDTGLTVHALCGKPSREHLEGMARRAGAWSLT